jgi:hypothetical protein
MGADLHDVRGRLDTALWQRGAPGLALRNDGHAHQRLQTLGVDAQDGRLGLQAARVTRSCYCCCLHGSPCWLPQPGKSAACGQTRHRQGSTQSCFMHLGTQLDY